MAGIMLLLIVLLIIILIISSIGKAIRGRNSFDTDTLTDTDISLVSQAVQPAESSSVSSDVQTDTPSVNTQLKFDADNKLIIDTDTLEGKKAVALTFDDGPGEYTEKLINGLNARGAKATFFMCGSCVEQYPEVLPMMVEGGHQIGNHTYNHSDITSLSTSEMNDQIERTDNAINNACGRISSAFRPPYGSHTADIDKLINKTITLWSVDTVDWNTKDASKIKETIVSSCYDGDIILLHDIYESSVDGALSAIDELQSQGYVFVTVDELLTRYGYSIEPGSVHTSQYAVYETNSPYAAQYEQEIREKKQREQADRASSEAAGAFYTGSSSDRATDTDTGTSAGAGTYSITDTDTYTYTYDDIITDTDTDYMIY